jgi:chitodextrinase
MLAVIDFSAKLMLKVKLFNKKDENSRVRGTQMLDRIKALFSSKKSGAVSSRPNKKKITAGIFIGVFAIAGPAFIILSQASSQVTTTKSGNWNDGSVWSTGVAPLEGELLRIRQGHTVTIADETPVFSGVFVEQGATLEFNPSQSATLETSANIVVEGTLRMKPANADVQHLIRFVDVDETLFVGGGMSVLDTDVGLWVMKTGQLDIAGSEKKSWTRLASGVNAGATTIDLEEQPSGWRVGDEISVTPTQAPGVGNASWDGFDLRTITAVSGNRITLDRGLQFPHPKVNNKWTAEVLNLSRNVRIEGTGDGSTAHENNGRAHIFIHSGQTQSIKNLAIRHMGPRQKTGQFYRASSQDVPIYEPVIGRYSLHFHHSMEGSRDSIVDSVVTRNSGGHGFVPHGSHGITIKNSIAYDGWADAYWWDPPADDPAIMNDSNEVVWERNVAAIVRADPYFRGYSLSGFNLGSGSNMKIVDSVAVGIQGNKNSSGFHWPSTANSGPSLWDFKNNVSHNNKVDGIFVWQNTSARHLVEDYVAYHNGEAGIDHGAYGNRYFYQNLELFGNGAAFSQHSRPDSANPEYDGYGFTVRNVNTTDPLILTKHVFPPVEKSPALYIDCNFPKVIVNESSNPGYYDFVRCGLEPNQFEFRSILPGSKIRVQRADGSAYMIDDQKRVSSIPRFYDTPEDQAAPELTSVHVANVSSTKAEIIVNANEPIRAQIEYGTRSCPCNNNTQNTQNVLSSKPTQIVELSNLKPSTTYYYKITARDQANNPTISREYSFQTPASDQSPMTVDIASPVANGTVSNVASVQVSANAQSIERVDFIVDGQVVGSTNQANATIQWDTRGQSDGSRLVYAVARTTDGRVGYSEPRTVYVSNNPDTNALVRENWDASNGTAWGSGWTTSVARGYVDVRDNEGSIRFDSSSGAYASATNQAMPDTADTSLLTKTRFTATGTRAHLHMYLRASGQGERGMPANGYFIARHSDNAKASLNKIVNGEIQMLDEFFWRNDTVSYWVRFETRGNLVRARVWPEGSKETHYWNTSATDDSLSSGRVAIRYARSSGGYDVRFDNLQISDLARSPNEPTPPGNEDTEAPSVPSNLSGSAVSTSQINLTWTASTDNVGVAGYQVFRNGTKIAETTSTSFGDTGLVAGTEYTYFVRAFDAVGNVSGSSNTVSVTTQEARDTEAPSVPSNLSGSAVSTSQINLTWTASTDNVGVAGYQVFRNGTKIAETTSTSFGDTGLVAGTEYTYFVRAFDAVGNVSGSSNTVSVTTQAPPADPGDDEPTDPQPPVSSTTLRGVVSDTSGAALENVKVTVDSASGSKLRATTNSRGEYAIPSIEGDTTRAAYQLPRYSNQTLTIELNNEEVVQDVTLSPSGRGN